MHHSDQSLPHRLRFVPRLEGLEDRCVPSCTVVESNGVLTITGSQKADVIEIEDDGTELTITCDGEPVEHSGEATEVVLNLRAGNDTVTYTLTGELAALAARVIEVNLGNGHDTFEGTLEAGLAAGASLELTVLGQNGKDTLGVSADAPANIAADAEVAVVLSGGNGKDTVDAAFGGLLEGDFSLSASGGNGKDAIAADLTFDAGSTGGVDAEVLGGNGKDDLTFLVTDSSGDDGDPGTEDDSTLDDLIAVLDGGHGKDSVEASDLVDVQDKK
jgi:hypothetical protein